jgi:hypothetical protein
MPATKEQRSKIGHQILNWEARRDSKGHIAVYQLPAEDGGGSYEVGGINEKYNPDMARKLKDLVNAGKFAQAETAAVDFISHETDAAVMWTNVTAVEVFLRDTCFNRGRTGASKIYQIALKVAVDGDIGVNTLKAARIAEKHPRQLLADLRTARELYERKYAGRD